MVNLFTRKSSASGRNDLPDLPELPEIGFDLLPDDPPAPASSRNTPTPSTQPKLPRSTWIVIIVLMLALTALAVYGYVQDHGGIDNVLPGSTTDTPQASSGCDKTHASRPADLTYAGTYYNSGELDSFPASQDGIAHYYGDGEPLSPHTGSGKRFDSNAMWAASWFYPIGTRLRVTDTASGRSITVTVEDRGPNRVAYPDVIIDLTRGAFDRLDPTPGRGALAVHIEPLCAWWQLW